MATTKITNHFHTRLVLPGAGDLRTLDLEPGANVVDEVHWNAVKDESPVNEWRDAGLLFEEEPAVDAEKPVNKSGLASLSPAKAVERINTLKERVELEKLGADETRPQVQQALQRRLEALGTPKK